MHTILIAGAGGIGKATGLILLSKPYLDCKVIIGDRYESAANSAAKYVAEGSGSDLVSPLLFPESGNSEALVSALQQADIILDCLPGSQAPRLAQYAKEYNCHYANLTEYVKETDQVTEIAKDADTGFILQTGLAPGYINILGHHLFQKFTSKYQVDKIDSLDMKVGALSKHARAPYFYAYTWSPIGVATEYVKDAIVVQDFETKYIPSLSDTEELLLNGLKYEDDYTSGGAADLPKALAGRVKNLNYKTIRYPGHYNWVKKILDSAPAELDKVEFLHNTMMDQIPAVEDDVVVVFASVKGRDNNGTLRALEHSLFVHPSKIGSHTLRAIQTTTAAPLCQAASMLLKGKLSGPIFQSELATTEFLNGDFVKDIYGAVS